MYIFELTMPGNQHVVMELEEFECQVRTSIDTILNQLQTIAWSTTELETEVLEVGQAVQSLAAVIETFIITHQEAL